MSVWRDWEEEMPRFPLDDATAERLLSGELWPEDAPPGYSTVVTALGKMQASPVPTELSGEQATVTAAALEARSARTVDPSTPRRKPMLAKLVSAKVAAVVATTVLGATAAAAATGNLPSQAQSAVSDALSHVGVSVPNPHSHPNGPSNSRGSAPGDKGANDAHANFGQCTAFLAGPAASANTQSTSNTASGKDSSTAFSDLIADHGGSVASATAYCQGVVAAHASSKTTSSTGGSTSSVGSNDSAPGQTGDGVTPPSKVTVPNAGGAGTANAASGGKASGGTGTADTASGGASSAGSANATTHSGGVGAHRP